MFSSWSSTNKKKEKVVEDEKEKQLKQLKSTFPSLRRPNNDDGQFEIFFPVENQQCSLKVFIPADFPTDKPILKVQGPVYHQILDNFNQVVGCEMVESL
jgi:hypothetical protein